MPQPHDISSGQQIFHQMLIEAGIDPNAPTSFGGAWDVFKKFVEVPFDTASDGVLYEVGIYGFYGQDEFYLGVLRQFEATGDGEHDHFEQLHCEFRFPVNADSRSFGDLTKWWWADGSEGSWNDFVVTVEKRPEFIALRDQPPQGFFLEQEEV